MGKGRTIKISYKIKLLFIISLLILGLLSNFNKVQAGGNEPEFKLNNPALPYLNFGYTPQAEDRDKNNNKLSTTMEWKSNATKDKPITLQLKWLEGPGVETSTSLISSLNSVSEAGLPDQVLKVKVNEDCWNSLHNGIEVMGTGEDEVSLQFKLDKELLDEDWTEYTRGTYKGVIIANKKGTPNPSKDYRIGDPNKEEIIGIDLEIKEKTGIEISRSDSETNEINMDINKPINSIEEFKSENWLEWKIKTNIDNISVNLNSKGFEELEEAEFNLAKEEHRQYFKYIIKENNQNESNVNCDKIDDFHPNEGIDVSNLKRGIIKIIYSSDGFGEDKAWSNLRSGTYKDKIVLTVEG